MQKSDGEEPNPSCGIIKSIISELYGESSKGLSFDNALKASHEDRVQLRLNELSLQKEMSFFYGELSVETFVRILSLPEISGVDNLSKFVDLGSGRGNLVYTAAALSAFSIAPFRSLLGIELLPSLANNAELLLPEFRKLVPNASALEISLIAGDVVERFESWKNADFVICCCTCFEESLLRMLCEKFQMLKPGTIIVTTTRHLTQSSNNKVTLHGLKLIRSMENMPTSWGSATVFVYKRLNISRLEGTLLKRLIK